MSSNQDDIVKYITIYCELYHNMILVATPLLTETEKSARLVNPGGNRWLIFARVYLTEMTSSIRRGMYAQQY